MMEKIEKIEEKLENYESSNKDMKVALASNMEAIDGLNTKLDKISHLLGVLTENGGKMNESYPVRHSEFFWTNIFENAIQNKEGCNWGHGLSAAIKIGTPEKTVGASLIALWCVLSSPFFVEKTALHNLLPS